MNHKLILMMVMFFSVVPAWAVNELDPNLKADTSNATEGRVLECQKCEVTQASPVARHAHKELITPQPGVTPAILKN